MSKARQNVDKLNDIISVKDYGAKGDTKAFYGAGSIANGVANLSVAGANFTSQDVGKIAWVQYAAGTGNPLRATVTAVASPTQITLSSPAGATVSAVDVFIGTDDSSAIQAAINALPITGGVIQFPEGEYSFSNANGVLLGNGAAGAISARQNIILVGLGGSTGPLTSTPVNAVTIHYTGATIGTQLINAQGPVRIALEDIGFNGNFFCVTGWNLKHVFLSRFRNCSVFRTSSVGIKMGAWGLATTGVFTGCSDNIFENVVVSGVGAAPFRAWDIGETAYDGGLDVSQNTFILCSALVSDNSTNWGTTNASTSAGFALRFCDNLRFVDCFVSVAGLRRGWGIRAIPPSGASPAGAFPTEISWDGPLVGGLTVDNTSNTWNPTLNNGRGFNFNVLNDGDMSDSTGGKIAAPLPTSNNLNNNEGITGETSSGLVLDRYQIAMSKAATTYYTPSILARQFTATSVANSTTPTTVYTTTIRGNTMRVYDRTIGSAAFRWDRGFRFRASGSYWNNSGSSSDLTVTVTLGATTLFTTGAVSVTTAAGFRSFVLDLTFGTRNVSNLGIVSGRFELGAPFSAGGQAQSGPTIYTQDQTGITENLATDLALTMTVTHGTANASITLSRDHAYLELL